MAKHAYDTIHFHEAAIATTTPYVLIDLSDTTNYKHVGTNHIHLGCIHVTAIPSTTGNWSIKVGVISEVDATNGTALWIYGIRFSQILYVAEEHDWTIGGTVPRGLNCKIVSEAFARIVTNDSEAGNTHWQTDVGLASPVGAAAGATGKPGAGDLVMLVTENSGSSTLSLDITARYFTG